MPLEFWQRRRSRGENRSDFWWALKLSVAFCKVNLILCSMRPSIGGADPLIDDQTPLSCLSKQPTQNPHGEQRRAVATYQSMQKAVQKKEESVRLCAAVCSEDLAGWGHQRVEVWTTELRPVDSTAIFIPGKVPITLNYKIAFSFQFALS